MTRRKSLGFDRRLDLDWLDAAAAKAATGATPAELRDYLGNLLEGVVSGTKSNSGRGKTVTVLTHIWGDVPASATGLRGRCTEALAGAEPDARLALHWAMMLGTYPIFADVAGAVGRLLMLQGSFSLAQLTRRLVEAWGERSTMIRAAQRVVRSMVQWGVLKDTAERGVYVRDVSVRRLSESVAELLLEAVLLDSDQHGVPFEQLVGHAALFPFDVRITAHRLRAAAQFRVHRQGLDVDLVELVDRGGR
jgi:hypothetical protein